MASRKPLVINNGQIQQIQSGDVLDAVISEVDLVSLTNNNAGSIVIGMPVYSADADDVDKAQANAVGTTEVIGLVQETSIATTASGFIQTDGVLSATTTEWDAVAGTTGGLTPGAIYFLSSATAGELTETAPTTAGQFVLRVGKALSTTEMEISISQPIKL